MTGSGTVTARSAEVTTYLQRVDAALADLPADERGDLLDELATHLDELATEGDMALEARLGTPEAYAAELRSSAGLPPRAGSGRAARWQSVLLRWDELRRRPSTRAVADFLRTLRPAWWVVRAWVVLALLTWYAQPHWWSSLVVVPDVGPDGVSLALLVAAVIASVQLGRRGRPTSRTGVVAVAGLNLAAAVGFWPVLLMMNEAVHTGALNYPGYNVEYVPVAPEQGLYANGVQVWNVYPYDADGTMLHDVRLYDQDGNPLSLGLAPDGTRKPVLDSTGRLVQNAFPYRYVEEDGTVADPDAGPAVDAPALVGSEPTSSPTPTPTQSPVATRGDSRKR